MGRAPILEPLLLPDVRLIAILDPAPLGERALDAARAAQAGGITMLQVRMKNSGAGAALRWTRRLIEVLRVPVWVNDRADVAQLAGAAGVHLGQDDLSAARVRSLAPDLALGVSVGSVAEAVRAGAEPADYWSIGSVYTTGSKSDAGPPIGVKGFADLAGRAPGGVPCVAIGGVTVDRIPDLMAAGATGVAVISAIFGAHDVEAAARSLREALETQRW